ncbi:unnamed protein product [Paramecium pentaurelia]|uniref:Cyclic nucleotide-binding domain-containing protein n=1 Tax=Paramecium pentaurelia TaxID=43138 RepID=A0A8S1TYP6_9CILI|nr:unnamed protein product [Paramecium pentaurelia]
MKPQPKISEHRNFQVNQQQINVDDPQDKTGIEIFSHETQLRKREKLSPILRSNSGHQEQLIQQYNNPQQLITPKNETITERLQTFGHVDLLKQSKSFRKLIVYFHQKDFIKMLLNPFKLTSNFTLRHFNLINDLSASYKFQLGRGQETQKSLIHQYISLIDIRIQLRLKFRTIKTKCKQYLTHIHNQIPLIEPMSNAKFVWDLICFAIRIYLIVVIPVIIVFHGQNFVDKQLVPLLLFSIALIFDIVIRAFTITYDQGLPVRDRYLLFKKQLNFSTALEFFSFIYTIIITIEDDKIIDKYILGDGWPKFLLALLYIQVINILKFIDVSQYSLKLSRMQTSIVDLIKLITMILLVQHIFSCVWIVFGVYSLQNQEDSWLNKYDNDDWSFQFLQSFYFICVTTFTVGYGDLTPKNPPEQIFTIIYMFLCMLLFSYTVNTIGSILTQIKESSEKIKSKLTAINQYMHNKSISPTLQFKVREQLYFYLKQEIIQQVNEQSEIIQLLPEDLQHSLKIEAAKSLLNKCSFFSDNFSKDILNQLLEEVNFQMYQPGAMIHSKEEFYIHIIEQGQVDVMYKKKIIQTLEKYDYFGLEEFISQQANPNITFKSTAFTSVLSIPYSYFHKILSQNDLENQKFHNLLTSSSYLSNFCFICKTKSHKTQLCPMVHFIPNKEVVIKKYLYRKKQKKRVSQERKLRLVFVNQIDDNEDNKLKQIKFINTKTNQKMIEDAVIKFKNENQFYLEQLFPNIEQPISVDSQSESENENPDELKDQSFSEQNFNSRRASKQIPNLSSKNLIKYQVLEKMKKERLSKHIQQQQSPLLMVSQYNQINPSTQIISKYNLKKIIQAKSLEDEQLQLIEEINFFDELRTKMNNLLLFPNKEQEQIEFWYKKLSNLKEDFDDMANFEQLKNYEIFNRQWNVDLVVKKTSQKPRKFRGLKKLKRYLLFPYLFINKYIDRKDTNDPNKTLEKSKRKRPSKPKAIKKTRVTPKQ